MIDVAWAQNGSYVSYADTDIAATSSSPAIPGKITQMDKLDDIVDITDSGTSQSVTITLDDTDGTIKAIMDSTDIHKRDVRIYQWFTGLDYTDRFLLFAGKINSPITWSEKDRTVTITAVSTLEDFEIGFSPEDGNQGYFTSIPDELMGVGWPMAFGYPVNAKTIQLDRVHSGLLGEAITFPAATNTSQLAMMEFQQAQMAFRYSTLAAKQSNAEALGNFDEFWQLQAQMDENLQEQANLSLQAMQPVQIYVNGQLQKYKSSFRVIGGQYFPQNTPINLNIDNAKVYGTFNGDIFSIISYTMPYDNYTGQITPMQPVIEDEELVPGGVNVPVSLNPGLFVESFFFGATPGQGGSPSQPFFAQAGSQVTIWDNEPIRYVVSLIPGTVVNATANATISGGYQQYLFDVPTDFYTVEWEQFGDVGAVILTVTNALSKPIPYSEYIQRAGGFPQLYEDTRLMSSGYGDDVFVTFQSTVGPNVADILIWFIEHYSQHSYDATSFNAARTYLANYPANFSISDRKPVMQVLQEIAYQARCALYLRDEVFYLLYLPVAPTPVSTITEDDILADQGMTITYTPDSDSLVTKAIGTWEAMGAQDQPNQIILRGNITKYGLLEEDTDYYIYNNADLVIKAMTFWMIRKTNTWKQLSFNAPLTMLALETFDCVNLNFAKPYVASSEVIGIVKQAAYDSASNSVALVVWVPVRAGEMTVYPFAHPSTLSPQLLYPLPVDVEQGYIDTNATPDPQNQSPGAGGALATRPGNLQFGWQNNDPYRNSLGSRRYSSIGQGSPSDQGDGNPGAPLVPSAGAGVPDDAPPPSQDIRWNLPEQDDTEDTLTLDLDGTLVLDKRTENGATLRSFFAGINEDNQLMMSTAAIVSDQDGDTAALNSLIDGCQDGNILVWTGATFSDGTNEAIFNFQYDTTGQKWGAGTAFLQA
jgi:hypothetical protein